MNQTYNYSLTHAIEEGQIDLTIAHIAHVIMRIYQAGHLGTPFCGALLILVGLLGYCFYMSLQPFQFFCMGGISGDIMSL